MSTPDTASDAAWVAIDAPLAPQALAEFCRDLERLYRINPYLVFQTWRSGTSGQIQTEFLNLSNHRNYDLKIRLKRESEFIFTIIYDHGAKLSTRFEVESMPGGSRLTITDVYRHSDPLNPVDPSDADKSLHAWGVALQTYLQRESRWGNSAIWRWYMRRVWIPMRPAARRITFIILIITLAEIALFGLVILIYWIEQ